MTSFQTKRRQAERSPEEQEKARAYWRKKQEEHRDNLDPNRRRGTARSRKLYIWNDTKMTAYEIADRFSCSVTTVSAYIREGCKNDADFMRLLEVRRTKGRKFGKVQK